MPSTSDEHELHHLCTNVHNIPKYTRDAPSLPPELVHEVFRYLTISMDEWKPRLPLDLMASSMASRAWYNEARGLIDENFFRSPLAYRRYTSAEIRRFADLIRESKRLRLDYSELMLELHLDIEADDNCDFKDIADALAAILRLSPGNLFKLEIETANLYDTSTGSDSRFYLLFDRLQPACDSIQSIDIHGHDKRGMFALPTRLADFVASLGPRLETIRFDSCALDDAMYSALSRCTSLQDVFLDFVAADNLHTVLPSWPRLRHFEYVHVNQSWLARTFQELTLHCPLLTEFVFKNDLSNPLADNEPGIHNSTLCLLLRHYPGLRRFEVSCNAQLDDTVLRFLLRYGRAMEHIELFECGGITGDCIMAEGDDVWPKLQSLSLLLCGGISRVFMERIVAGCPMLESVMLPEHLYEDDRLVKVMLKHGFVSDGGTWWRKESAF